MKIFCPAINLQHFATLICLGLYASLVGVLTDVFADTIVADTSAQVDRPNIVWILSEDNSVHYLSHFFDGGAETPNISAMAAEGITFRRAYSCAPVCSVARTTLMTSCYAPRLGTQFHRRHQAITLPESLQLFPAYLRQSGYYTTNNSKEDYNTNGSKQAWDASSPKASWKNRPTPDTPFFHMETFTTSHEGSLHFPAEDLTAKTTKHHPATVTLAPYLPDTSLVRYTHARYLDRIAQIDQQVGQLINQLKSDGLWESTIVFYFGDHGGVLPRSKGYLYDTGTHVPLVIRIPPRYQPQGEVIAGSNDDRYVEFVDFGPTVLQMAGVAIPTIVDGHPFLGSQPALEEAFSSAFSYADRFDERCEFSRSLHRGRYHYIRNYQAFLPDALQNNYRYQMAAYQEWRELYRSGALSEVQSAFFRSRPAEMLFDLDADPHEVNNLADDPQYSALLLEMRADLQAIVKQLPDLSFIPEHALIPAAKEAPLQFAQESQQRIAQLVDFADICLESPPRRLDRWRESLNSTDPWARFWALTSFASLPRDEIPPAIVQQATALLDDDQPLTRTRAAVFLSLISAQDPRPIILKALADSSSELEALLVLNDLTFVQDNDATLRFAPEMILSPFKGGEVARRLKYLNALAEE